MKTFNRGKLRRLAQAGRLVVVDSYHFDDMYGSSRSSKEMPVIYGYPVNRSEMKDGIVYLDEFHFTGKSGSAYYSYDNREDMVTLHVHSNLNFTFKILPETPNKE